MTKKQYLRRGYNLRQQIKTNSDVLKELEENIDNLKGIKYSKDKLQGGPLQDDTVLVEKINKIIETEEIIKEKSLLLKKFQAELYLQIMYLENTNEKILLQARYILNETWEQVAYRLGYSVMHVHRIHAKALENFQML